MIPLVGLKLESIKLPPQTLQTFTDVAKRLGCTRSFLEREYLIDAAERAKQGKYTKRLRTILDIENGRQEHNKYADDDD